MFQFRQRIKTPLLRYPHTDIPTYSQNEAMDRLRGSRQESCKDVTEIDEIRFAPEGSPTHRRKRF